MKKKALLASAVALATASAMTFAPVSYKVIDKAHAAPAVVSDEKIEAVKTLKGVFQQLNDTELGSVKVLKNAYDAMINQLIDEDLDTIDFASDLPFLNTELGTTNSPLVEAALTSFLTQLAEDYKSDSVNLGDASSDLEAELANLNQVLVNANILASGSGITTDDVAKLLVAVEDEFRTGAFDLTSGDVVSVLFDAIVDYANAQWSSTDNNIIVLLNTIYDDVENLQADVEILKTNRKAELDGDTDKKAIYKKGAAALAISYAKYKLAGDERLSVQARTNGTATLELDTNNLTIPLSMFLWTSDGGDFDPEDVEEGKLILELDGPNTAAARTVTIKATLIDGIGIPSEFAGIEIISQEVDIPKYESGGGGFPGGDIGVVSPDLNLVSDYEAKAEAIEDKVSDYLEANPELFNNTLKYGLQKALEEQLRQALLVQAAGAVTVSNGVTTLNITPEQMSNIYDTQLNTVLKALEDTLEAQGLDIDPAVVLTYNIGITSNGEVNLTKALIDSLTSKGIDAVGVKTGDAVVELDLDQLDGTSKLQIKKAAAAGVSNAKSEVYSINVLDADGNALSGFKKPYRVTLPVSGNATNVTIAHLADGSQTLIGGHYDAATKTVTFYTNQLGDFVVVENKTSFDDIANIAWAEDQIQFLADKGILQGRGNGVFDPRANITRAEFTAMIIRVLSLNETTELTFNDVSEDAWYYDAVAAARAYGIINGRSASQFDPNAQITREEMASIVSNSLKTVLGFEAPSNIEEILGNFVDGNNVVAVHRENVALLANEGIVQGKGNDNYDPKGNASRAEVAVIVEKIFNFR